MSFFGKLFGSETSPAMPKESEQIARTIELTEGELQDATVRLAAATDAQLKQSLELLVARKTQAVKDLEEKLRATRARENT